MSKVFLIIPTLVQGGAERVISELANEFTKKGIEVHLVLLAKATQFYSIDSRITIHKLGFENKDKLRRLYSEIMVFIKFRRLLKQERPDSVLSFMVKYNVFTILASRFLKIPVYVSDRSNPFKKIPKSRALLRKYTYKWATGIISQTNTANSAIANITAHTNIKTIHNPIRKIKVFNFKREKIILNVGRLVPEKGQKFLINAFSELSDETWKLVILGDGPLRNDLEHEIHTLNISNRVILTGAVNNVDEWLARSSIFAFTSISEGFPNALAEAMAAGLACISFDCDAGPKDLIDNDKNGFLIEKNNTIDFTEKLNYLVKCPNKRNEFGKQGRLLSAKYSLKKISKLYLDFLLESKN